MKRVFLGGRSRAVAEILELVSMGGHSQTIESPLGARVNLLSQPLCWFQLAATVNLSSQPWGPESTYRVNLGVGLNWRPQSTYRVNLGGQSQPVEPILVLASMGGHSPPIESTLGSTVNLLSQHLCWY